MQKQVRLDTVDSTHIKPLSLAIWSAIPVCPIPLDRRALTKFLHVGFPFFSTWSSFCSQEWITSRRNVSDFILFFRLMKLSPRTTPRFRIFAASISPRYVEISTMSVSPVIYSRDNIQSCHTMLGIISITTIYCMLCSWSVETGTQVSSCITLYAKEKHCTTLACFKWSSYSVPESHSQEMHIRISVVY